MNKIKFNKKGMIEVLKDLKKDLEKSAQDPNFRVGTYFRTAIQEIIQFIELAK